MQLRLLESGVQTKFLPILAAEEAGLDGLLQRIDGMAERLEGVLCFSGSQVPGLFYELDARANRISHGFHKGLPAIRVDCVVARVRSDHQAIRFFTLGEARRDREHDAITKRHDGLFHALLLVVPLRDLASFFKEIGLKFLADEIERNRKVRNPQLFRVPFREGNFPVIVLRPVVKAQASDH